MEEKLTKEQIAELESLTPEEANQLEALIRSNGEIKEEQLESVVGGLSSKVKKILSWGGAALGAIAVAGASAYAFKKLDSHNGVGLYGAKSKKITKAIEASPMFRNKMTQ